MKFENWKDAAELIGIVAIVASLIFVGLQMKQAYEIADVERRFMMLENIFELRSTINEHADVWTRGNSSHDLAVGEATIFENLVANLNDFAWFASRAARNLGNETGEQATIAEFVLNLHRNPRARDVWRSQEEDYVRHAPLLIPAEDAPSEWTNIIEAGLAKLDQAQD